MARAGSACSPGALVAACLTAGEHRESVHTHLGVVHLQNIKLANGFPACLNARCILALRTSRQMEQVSHMMCK